MVESVLQSLLFGLPVLVMHFAVTVVDDGVRGERTLDDAFRLGTVEIEDVILPVGGEDGTVCFEVAMKSGEPISGLENGEELGNEVDQHATQYERVGCPVNR